MNLILKYFPEFNYSLADSDTLVPKAYGRGHHSPLSAHKEGNEHLQKFPHGEEHEEGYWKKFTGAVVSKHVEVPF